ncbi:glutaredoxin family protein [soil metagenome]
MSAEVPHSTDARVVLYGRAGCHLCAAAREVVAAVCAESGAGWVEIDIDSDPRLVAAFTEQVPVTFVDGGQHDFWRVDPDRLRRAVGRPLP